MIRFAKSVTRKIQKRIWDALILELEKHNFQSTKITVSYTFELKNFDAIKTGTISMNDVTWIEDSDSKIKVTS